MLNFGFGFVVQKLKQLFQQNLFSGGASHILDIPAHSRVHMKRLLTLNRIRLAAIVDHGFDLSSSKQKRRGDTFQPLETGTRREVACPKTVLAFRVWK